MFETRNEFWAEENGAVTVDWVVLTSAIVSLGAIVVAALTGSLEHVSSDVATFMSSQSVISTF